jgi:inorganic triphosphatase YgiF
MEKELKLLIDEGQLGKLEDLQLIDRVTVGKPAAQMQRDVYFDTPAYDLMSNGMGLRVRHAGGKRLQTLKAGGSVQSGLHQRDEWEAEIDADVPDVESLKQMAKASEAALKILNLPALQDKLQPIFTLEVERNIRQLRLPGGEEVEMAIDRGHIVHGEKREPISEIELEIKSGSPQRLFGFALELLDAIPMRIGSLSKAERGYALLARAKPKVVKAEKLKLRKSMSIEDAFIAIVSNCLAQIHGNEQRVMHDTDSESVHQMRVGLRRLRSALDMFEDIIAAPAVIQEELKQLAGRLGAARDWQVLAGSTLERVGVHAPKEADIGKLIAAAQETASRNRAAASEEVASLAYTRLQLQLAEWLGGRQWRESLDDGASGRLDKPATTFARSMLKRSEKRLLKRGKALDDNEPESRHRVRIAAKKARYATEFFASLYPKQHVRRYLSALSAMQEELGWLNDAAVADELLAQLQLANPSAAADAAFARGYLTASIYGSGADIRPLWKNFARARPPYKH